MIQPIKPNNDSSRILNSQIKPKTTNINKKNEFENQNYDQTVPMFNRNNNNNKIENGAKLMSNVRPNNLILQPKPPMNFQQGTFPLSQPPPHQYINPNFNYNNVLAFPPAFSHQLATLTIDQQNYLLQQQKLLVMAMAASEQKVQSDINNMFHNVYLPFQQQQQQQQQLFHHNYPYPNHYDYNENQNPKQGNNNNNNNINKPPVLASFLSTSTATSSSSPSSPMFNKNLINNHPNNHLNAIPQNRINYDSNLINSNNKYQEITTQKLNSPFYQAKINNFDTINQNNNNNNQDFKPDEMIKRMNIIDNNTFIQQNFIDPNNTNGLNQMTLNNHDKIRFLANQPYRQHR